MYIKNQNFLVMGTSKSGFSSVEYLINEGAKCSFVEEKNTPKINENVNSLVQMGAKRLNVEQAEQTLNNFDVMVLSPGVPINHPLAVKAKQLGVRIIGELELGFCAFMPNLIAVTGTNGKTTTVNLIDAILKESGKDSQMVGNVGIPLISQIRNHQKDKIYVAEVSSFQLETVSAFCPHVSCVLNLTPDHLERHYNMENYAFLKKRIFKNQKESEWCVLNYDDQLVREFFTEIKAKVKWVSLNEKVDGGYLSDGKLYFCGEYVTDVNRLKLQGEHNVYDALFAVVCAKIMGLENEKIATALENFKGVKHRLEHVCNKKGVDYYNDSKATNTASTISALNSIKAPTILILGGSEKGEDYVNLFEKIKTSYVKHVVLTGASRFNMLDVASNVSFNEITITESFENAVKIAAMIAVDGDAVLLSPACASFDKFSGYAERGEAFVKIVEGL